MLKKININEIEISGGTQQREKINDEVVAEYAHAMKSGAEFPPVIVFSDGARNWLADGFHRWHAARSISMTEIQAKISSGTQRQAILFSAGANNEHGIRLTNADKRRAVGILLADKEWSKWSDREIASHCGVTHPFVSKLRPNNNIETNSKETPHVVTVTTTPKHGPSFDGKKEEVDASPSVPESAPEPTDETAKLLDANAELAESMQQLMDENKAMVAVFEADDNLAAALVEIKRLTEVNRILEERVRGLMNEVAAAKQAAVRHQKRADKCEKAKA